MIKHFIAPALFLAAGFMLFISIEAPRDTEKLYLGLAVALFILSFGVFLYRFGIYVQRLIQKKEFAFNFLALLANLLGVGLSIGGGILTLFVAAISTAGTLGAWGRPLRLNKKITQASLVKGEHWSAGPLPDVSVLDPITRQALEQLWYFDAQKEHASVPAFARLIWILTSLGAPALLLKKLHYCGLQEIEHARRTLALANAYGDSEKTFAPLPAMMGETLGFSSHPWVELAKETFWDGCLIEEFNADVAQAAAEQAEDPAALQMVTMIAKEERFHAQVAWDILELCLEKEPEAVRKVLAKAMSQIPSKGAFCYSTSTLALADKANPELLRKHGRVLKEHWQPMYEKRVSAVCERIQSLIEAPCKQELSLLI
jgi:hypothetical protein